MTDTTLDGETSAAIPRLRMTEIGTTGLKTSRNQILEEFRKDLAWPNVIWTYKQMAYDSTISASLALFEMLMERVEWEVIPPPGATETQIKRAKFIAECKDDMEHSWRSFIKEALSFIPYGFSVHEKVFRKRYKANGSKFNDGYVGWKKLAVRSQDTISGWEFSDDGRDLQGVWQNLNLINNEWKLRKLAKTAENGGKLFLPIEKLLIFKYNSKRGNPQGNSPLKSIYIDWKYRTNIEEIEAVGISRDMQGMPIIKIPPIFMSPDATPEQKKIYEHYQNAINLLNNNESAGMILPQAFDPDSRQPLFTFELLGVQGGKSYDTDKIIRRYDNKILTTLFSDFLKLGQDQVGSFALAGEKTNLMSMAVDALLAEIADVLNTYLIPQTFQLNGWDDAIFPKMVPCEIREDDLESFSSAVQKVFAVNAVEMDRDVYNVIREKVFKLPPKAEDEPVEEDNLPNNRSRSGDGMATVGDGTSTTPTKKDSSVANKSNK